MKKPRLKKDMDKLSKEVQGFREELSSVQAMLHMILSQLPPQSHEAQIPSHISPSGEVVMKPQSNFQPQPTFQPYIPSTETGAEVDGIYG